ncbi:MAG: hypothetical protein WCD82_02360 [Xanthobacteraceae bacterium]
MKQSLANLAPCLRTSPAMLADDREPKPEASPAVVSLIAELEAANVRVSGFGAILTMRGNDGCLKRKRDQFF